MIDGEKMLARNTSRTGLSQVVSRIVMVCAACMVAHGAWAADLSALSGAYKYVPEQSSDISQAVDKAVEKMNFIKRPIARGRLEKTNVPYQRIRIQINATEAEITYDDRKPIRMSIDGPAIKWTRDDGEVFDVSARVDGGKLVQTYKAEDGMRVNSFHLDAKGALHLRVEVSSPQLPQAMSYELVYQPAGG